MWYIHLYLSILILKRHFPKFRHDYEATKLVTFKLKPELLVNLLEHLLGLDGKVFDPPEDLHHQPVPDAVRGSGDEHRKAVCISTNFVIYYKLLEDLLHLRLPQLRAAFVDQVGHQNVEVVTAQNLQLRVVQIC